MPSAHAAQGDLTLQHAPPRGGSSLPRARIRPRDYQVEAARWALERGRAVVCMPTGTGKTVVAGLWIRWLLESGRIRRVLVLEPTRFMVEQASWFLRERMGLDARPVHGGLPPGLRRRGLEEARVVVATPEIVVAEMERFRRAGFDAVVVDECHHTSGLDSYRIVMEELPFRYRLGLSAFIPPSRLPLIRRLIGEERCWGWGDPGLAKYIPKWAAEVYEAPLNEWEHRLYAEIEALWERVHGRERVILGNALRWLARDGALALRESYEKGGLLHRLLRPLEDLLYHPRVRPAHKFEALVRALADHEPGKAIVFVDRVAIAEYIARRLGGETVLILGRGRVDPREALERARGRARIIVSTSAGEEGIDLPEADLVVSWSHTASPLRFVQRLGRMLRAVEDAGRRQKYAVYIATPDTVDMDSLIDGLMMAQKHGIYVGLEPSVLERLLGLSRRRRILELIEENPAPLDVVARALGAPRERVEASLRWLLRHGYAVYIYTPIGRVYASAGAIGKLYDTYRESLTPKPGVEATVSYEAAGERGRRIRGDYGRVLEGLLRALDTRGPLERVSFTVFSWEGGLVRMHRYTYSFLVDSRDKVRLVADNAFSVPAP